ncbi:CotH kinase family protein [Fulvivirgaceae bacterium BMA12]|uniref:CotH kinase family protein n=1 Tax=Agaribacillus aureus TaxID=3051825 RepID=A0ABT8L563_9BACT|nr:CotH kinase family protein [Fulvivirgaceae bacterium BMA12]
MIIKSPNDSLFKDKILKGAVFLFIESKLKYLVMLVLLGIIVLASVKYGRDLQKRGQYGNFQLFLGNALQSKTRIPINFMKGVFSKSERLDISIKHIDFQKLAYYAGEAQELGYIASHLKEEYLPAEIDYQGKTYKVKLRLKGLELKHLQPDKWSLKIKVKGDQNLKGLSEFSIQAPPTRAYINEWIYHKFLHHENLLGLKTDFVTVTLNGKDLGVFNLEEGFTKTVLERNQRREGLIFRIINGTTKVYGENKILEKGLSHGKHIGIVSRMANAFMNGKMTTTEVFDKEKTARYFAVSDLFGGIHGHLELNFPIYFNPINQKFEPIGYDANSGMVFKEGFNGIAGSWHGPWTAGDRLLAKRIFSDTNFYKAYVRQLETLSQAYYQEVMDSLQSDLNAKLNTLYKSYPEYYYSADFMAKNLATIKKTLLPDNKIQNAVYNVQKKHQRIQVTFNNVSNVPLQLLGLNLKGKPLNKKTGRDQVIYPHLQKENNEEVVYFSIPENFEIADSLLAKVSLQYKVLGASGLGNIYLKPISGEHISFPKDYLDGKITDLMRFDFLDIDETLKEITVKSGDHRLREDLIIPQGYHFLINQGTSIDIINNGKIICRSPLRIIGSQEFPVRIYSSDTSAQGLTVLQAGQPSQMEHVIFENMRNPSIDTWSLSGAINFYESPVTIINCIFDTNYSEDMLNIIQSRFKMDKTTLRNTFSDAFDGDFVKGTITDSYFELAGNDAIDVSGSDLVVENVRIDRAGDKGLSAGEDSYITAKNIKIDSSEIAVASKDQSHIEMQEVAINYATIGFTCFQKKPEYDPATITANKVKISNTELPYLLEERSGLQVNGDDIAHSRANVKEVLYGVEYGKKTIR